MAISASFTVIAANRLDPDSPITTSLMNDLHDNTIFNNEWIGAKGSAVENHEHQGLGVDGTAQVNFQNIGTIAADFSSQEDAFSGAGPNFSTGALSGEPLFCWVAGFVESAGQTDAQSFVGFVRGTGAKVRGATFGLYTQASNVIASAIDNNAVGGFSTPVAGGRTAFDGFDIDVDNFTKAAPGVRFVNNGSANYNAHFQVVTVMVPS